MICRNKKLFQIDPLFILLAIIIIISGYKKEFFYIILIVFFHELSHIFVAYLFKVKIEKIFLTPLGQRAILKDFDFINTKKKFLIVLAGPFLNLILYIIFKKFLCSNYNFVKEINLSILLFNILPIFPLDGGNIVKIYLDNKIGIINSSKIVNKLSIFLSKVIIFLGIVQIILYPLNISLLCLGIYLNKINKQEKININYIFYKFLLIKDKKLSSNNLLDIKFFLFSNQVSLKKLLNMITWNKYYIIYFFNEDKNLYTISESDIINCYFNKGPNSTILDILAKK